MIYDLIFRLLKFSRALVYLYLVVCFIEKSSNLVILTELIRGVCLQDLKHLDVVLRLLLDHLSHVFQRLVRIQ